jgi:hypothetical protein
MKITLGRFSEKQILRSSAADELKKPFQWK